MKKIEIKINKTEILEKVSLSSAYLGYKAENAETLYDRISTIEADKPLLGEFWTEMCGIMTEKFREFIVNVEKEETGMNLTLELSNAYDDALTPSVKDNLVAAIVTGICGRWFRFTFPEKSEEWLNESGELIGSAMKKLCYRKKPVRGGKG
ncbi:MAG: hypothetical protein J1E16_06375 [Muribaculaceae bacterium]|nr:hypothetical protein [Muribaculaceae bacterium]